MTWQGKAGNCALAEVTTSVDSLFRKHAMRFPSLIPGLSAALLLTACATEEFRRAEAECADQARATHPVVLEARMMRQSRKAWVPDGSTMCESTVTSVSNDSRRRTVAAGDSRDSRSPKDVKKLKDAKDAKDSADSKDTKDSPYRGSASVPGVPAEKMQPTQKLSPVRERENSYSTAVTQAVQTCRPGLREVVEYYDTPVRVDVNADARQLVIGHCTAALCVQRFGNDRCKQ